jgi:hypothetical protein
MIRPGRHDIPVARAGVESPSQKIEIRDGENSARFQLQPTLSLPMLRGTVRDAATRLPIPDVRVTAMSLQQGTVTDEDGSFEFKRLTDEEQDLWIWKDGHAFKKARTERLERGRTVPVDVTLDPGATLALSIVGTQGEPAQKPVFLHVTPKDGPASSGWSTPELDVDETGHAAYRSVPPGRSKLIVVSMEGSATAEVDVPPGGASLAVRLK